MSLVGTAIALASQNVPMMIAAMALKGIGSGSQQLALAAIAEIVPNKHRGTAQAALDIVTLPWAVFGSLTGNAMVKYHTLGVGIRLSEVCLRSTLTQFAVQNKLHYRRYPQCVEYYHDLDVVSSTLRNSYHRQNSVAKSKEP